MRTSNQRLPILKTYKLYINGKFPRTESGRYRTVKSPGTGTHLANCCQASRKDLRDAVRAARKSLPAWASATAYLKGQILYRAAEMLEGRFDALAAEVEASAGFSPAKARKEIEASIDRLVYFAGWTDKIHQVFGSVNPVATSHFNFTTPEPAGVVGIICPDRPSLLPLVSMMSTAVLGGNSTVILASGKHPLPAITFAEVLATSDIPAGVVNILTGDREELAPHFATHMDINAVIDGSGDGEIRKQIREGSAVNLKRVAFHNLSTAAWPTKAAEDPYRILDTLEMKTVWHPVGV